MLELTDDIDARLEYFKELDHATRMLNHPGESLVLQTDFLYMVERVDICIDYLKEHVCIFSLLFATMVLFCVSATLSRSRNLPIPISAMHDTRHDADQDVLRRFSSCSICRCLEAAVRKGT